MEKIKKISKSKKRRMRKQKIHYDPIMDESIKNNVIVLHKSRKIGNCSYPISEQYINSIKNYMNIVDKDFHIVIKHDPSLDAKHYGKYVTNVLLRCFGKKCQNRFIKGTNINSKFPISLNSIIYQLTCKKGQVLKDYNDLLNDLYNKIEDTDKVLKCLTNEKDKSYSDKYIKKENKEIIGNKMIEILAFDKCLNSINELKFYLINKGLYQLNKISECPFSDCPSKKIKSYKGDTKFNLESYIKGERCFCHYCKKNYCYTCKSWDHEHEVYGHFEAMKIKQNEKKNMEIDKNELIIKTITIPCPNKECGQLFSKDNGCDHLICPNCNTHFCFRCGEKVLKSCYGDHLKYIVESIPILGGNGWICEGKWLKTKALIES